MTRSIRWAALASVTAIAACASDATFIAGEHFAAVDYQTACVHMERDPALVVDAALENYWRLAACYLGRWLDPSLCVSGADGPTSLCVSEFEQRWRDAVDKEALKEEMVAAIHALGGRLGEDHLAPGLRHRVYETSIHFRSHPAVMLDRTDHVASTEHPADRCYRDAAGTLQFKKPYPVNENLTFALAFLNTRFTQEADDTPSYNCHGFTLHALDATIPLGIYENLEPLFAQDETEDLGTYSFQPISHYGEVPAVIASWTNTIKALEAQVKDGDVLAFYQMRKESCDDRILAHTVVVHRSAQDAPPEITSKHREGPVLRHGMDGIVPLVLVYGFTVVHYRL